MTLARLADHLRRHRSWPRQIRRRLPIIARTPGDGPRFVAARLWDEAEPPWTPPAAEAERGAEGALAAEQHLTWPAPRHDPAPALTSPLATAPAPPPGRPAAAEGPPRGAPPQATRRPSTPAELRDTLLRLRAGQGEAAPSSAPPDAPPLPGAAPPPPPRQPLGRRVQHMPGFYPPAHGGEPHSAPPPAEAPEPGVDGSPAGPAQPDSPAVPSPAPLTGDKHALVQAPLAAEAEGPALPIGAEPWADAGDTRGPGTVPPLDVVPPPDAPQPPLDVVPPARAEPALPRDLPAPPPGEEPAQPRLEARTPAPGATQPDPAYSEAPAGPAEPPPGPRPAPDAAQAGPMAPEPPAGPQPPPASPAEAGSRDAPDQPPPDPVAPGRDGAQGPAASPAPIPAAPASPQPAPAGAVGRPGAAAPPAAPSPDPTGGPADLATAAPRAVRPEGSHPLTAEEVQQADEGDDPAQPAEHGVTPSPPARHNATGQPVEAEAPEPRPARPTTLAPQDDGLAPPEAGADAGSGETAAPAATPLADLGPPTPPREATRRLLAPVLGLDPGDVPIYRGPAAARLVRAYAADALAVAGSIVIGDQRDEATPEGLGLLAHELHHIARGGAARFVAPLAGPAGPPPADEEAGAERAEALATEVARGGGGAPPPVAPPGDPHPQPAARPARRDRGRWGALPAPWEPWPEAQRAPAPPGPRPAPPPPAPPPAMAAPAPAPALADAFEPPRAAAADRSLGARPAPAGAEPAPAPQRPEPGPDLDALAQQVYARLKRRLEAERRRGTS